jgi:quinol monooxygenase YgiN
LVLEKYESNDAFKFHLSTPHFQEFSRASGTMLAGQPEMTLYNEIK